MRWLVAFVGSNVLWSACAAAQYPESRFPVRPPPTVSDSTEWRQLATDPMGDGQVDNAGDARALWYLKGADDTLWVRLDVHGILDTAEAAVSVSFDVDGDSTNGLPWYGTNRAFRFDRMISVGLLRREGSSHLGYNGFSESTGVARGQYLTSKLGSIAFAMDPARGAYYIGVAVRDIAPTAPALRIIATVGRNARWNDDAMNQGAAIIPLVR